MALTKLHLLTFAVTPELESKTFVFWEFVLRVKRRRPLFATTPVCCVRHNSQAWRSTVNDQRVDPRVPNTGTTARDPG